MVDTALVVWISLALVGLALLVFSSFFGGGEGDVGGDFSGDVGGDMGGHDVGAGHGGISPLSIPMIATFLATSGSSGTMLYLGGFDALTTATIAGLVGILSFAGVYTFTSKFLIESQATSSSHEREYEGKTGVVTETIPEDGPGAIAVTARGARAVVTARSDGRRISIGREVLVKRVADGVALVEEVIRT